MKLATQARKRKDKVGEPKRIAILDPDKCKPKSPAYDYLKKVSNTCGKDCIQVHGKKIKISEDACAACIMRAKRCPDNAVRVVQLPAGLSSPTHSFGLNYFKLHGLPLPKPGKVTGLLGANGRFNLFLDPNTTAIKHVLTYSFSHLVIFFIVIFYIFIFFTVIG